ncbi:unnamed protein product [Triticum turgidum subsp. durum]|uniref:RING-type E3 ubiquitin transferase n=1 Tax=Triticum turgidum subsp. durum TaxID=4567 RepID=A0A9R0Z4F0_TRITD|nr:unnamed protein product [Triticum turgidum subsp. durum]
MSMEIEEEDSGETAPEMEAPGVSTVAIAVSGSRSSRHALKWALDKFVPGGRVLFRILHVRPPITMVPTPMGNYLPVSQVRDDVTSAYREELEWQARNMLLPYKKMCAQRQVEAEAVLLESDDVPAAISEEIDKFNIGKLVLGSSSRSIFRRKLKGSKTATKISECIPSFCTAYVVSKGKLSFVRSATSDACETPKTISSSTVSSPSSKSLSSAPSEWDDRNGTAAVLFRQSSLSSQRDHALANINRGATPSGSAGSEISYHADTTLKTNSHSITSVAQLSSSSSSGDSVYRSFRGDSFRDISDLQAAVSETATELKHSHDQDDLKLQIESMKVKLRHLQNLHDVSQNEPVDSTQKLEVLGKIRHPHLLLLLGACPERGCVVYEYMANGSLDDALNHRRNGMPPLAWYDRIRVAWEVATAVAFLHSARPDPIIHRDLKPANILLDRNLSSKVGDVGLSTALLHHSGAGGGGGQQQSTMVRNTTPVGTFCYIDPEYQRTGAVSAKSDVYALGVVVLQLLTGRTSPLGLAHAVETALEEDGGDSFAEMLDATAGQWPPEEARELAALALRCAEMRRRDRPGLREHILPALERIKDIAARAARETKALLRTASSSAAPGHFLCPILQEIMEDPCVAADGYTYDRKAIETWVSMKDKSPMTNLRLPSKSLIPNHSLRSAIMDWSSKNR